MVMPNVRQTLHNLVAVGTPTALIGAGTLPRLAAAGDFGAQPAAVGPPEGATSESEGARPSGGVASLGATVEVPATLAPSGGAPAPKDTIGVFLTPQSLVTFPVASVVLIVMWRVLIVVFPEWGTSKLVPFIGAFVLGVFIYYISLPENPPRRLKIIGAGIALLNSFFLAASALGIQTAT